MDYIKISESVFRDLISCKSKVDDMRMLLEDDTDKMSKSQILRRLNNVVYSYRYADSPQASEQQND